MARRAIQLPQTASLRKRQAQARHLTVLAADPGEQVMVGGHDERLNIGQAGELQTATCGRWGDSPTSVARRRRTSTRKSTERSDQTRYRLATKGMRAMRRT